MCSSDLLAQDLDAQFIAPPSQLNQVLTNSAFVPNGTDQSGAFFCGTYQWNLRPVSADTAVGTTPGGAGELVCVLDIGIDPDHSDVVGRVDPTLITSLSSAPASRLPTSPPPPPWSSPVTPGRPRPASPAACSGERTTSAQARPAALAG